MRAGHARAALSFFAVALSMSCLFAASACGPSPARRSILLITLDTLRADHLSEYGYPLATSPSLSRLAARGLRYEFALAPAPSTAPSHASMMTGRQPSFHSVGAFNSQFQLNPSAHTLAERLAEHGYATAAVVSNPVLSRGLGLDQGFEHYDDQIPGQGVVQAKSRTARQAVDLALAWLDQRDSRPFFLWLHFNDPHGPYDSNDKWTCPLPVTEEGSEQLALGNDHSGYRAIPLHQVFGQQRRVADYRRRYDCEIGFVDDQLGRLLNVVQATADLSNTLLVVTADHGESLGEDDFYFSHGHAIGLDQVRVPLILAGPGVPRGEVSNRVVSNVSIFHTVLDFAGVETLEHSAGDSLLAGPRDGDSPPVFVESLNQIGVAYGDLFLRRDLRAPDDPLFWKGGNPNSGNGTWKPLGRDVLRTLDGSDVGRSQEAVRAELTGLLDQQQKRVARAREIHAGLRSRRALSGDEIEALGQLGYLDSATDSATE